MPKSEKMEGRNNKLTEMGRGKNIGRCDMLIIREKRIFDSGRERTTLFTMA